MSGRAVQIRRHAVISGTAGGPVSRRGELSEFARLVLDAVEEIPPGRVLTYGDVAELVGAGSPRAVGRVLARHGAEVPWHRVLLATGRLPPGHERAALRLLRAEGTRLTSDGTRVELAVARWDGVDPGPGGAGRAGSSG